MEENKKDFEFTNLPEEVKDEEIKQEDFVLQQADTEIHEQKFQTKPTTFFKDSLKRFRKNKSSVVAAYILGILILLAIFVPVFSPFNVSVAGDSAVKNLEPKLFNSGGFWDGTITVTQREVDPYPGEHQYYPDPELYYWNGISNIRDISKGFTSRKSRYAEGGYLQSGFYGGEGNEMAVLETTASNLLGEEDEKYEFTLDVTKSNLILENFVVCDETMLASDESIPENFKLGLTGLQFVYTKSAITHYVDLVSPSLTHKVGIDGGTEKVDLSKIIYETTGEKTFNSFYFRLTTSKTNETTPNDNVCSLIRSLIISTDSTSIGENLYFSPITDSDTNTHGISFSDAMQSMLQEEKATAIVNWEEVEYANPGYWKAGTNTKFVKKIHQARATFATFTYDSYATLGTRAIELNANDLYKYAGEGWIKLHIECTKLPSGKWVVDSDFEFEILNPDSCPIVAGQTIERSDILVTGYDSYTDQYTFTTKAKDVIYWKYLGYSSMPKYLFGTDKTGRDMLTYVFEGLRNSLLLGLITFVVCFTFGLLWGAICGYFGGTVDLVMERLTDILSGVPWIVVMTIVVLKAGSSIGTFAFALCLTGWIGTAATTRTQFYRFRGREYVLASRTLGASDARLIVKHILPNAMGTIITGAVLMIPSVIFSEATISYLGLGFKDLSSLGVILSSNQAELTNHPYQLIFPSVIIALVMISFNLFGNGIRDAINPSLKGEGE